MPQSQPDPDPYPLPPVIYRNPYPEAQQDQPADPAGEPGGELGVILYVGYAMLAAVILCAAAYVTLPVLFGAAR